jgi:hypothetical protein
MQHYTILLNVLGPVILIVGLLLWYYVNRRKFNRRNQMGIELFRSYGGMIVTRFLEIIVRLISLFLILGGAGMIFKTCIARG